MGGFTATVVLIGVLFDPIAALAGLVLLIVVLATSFNLAKQLEELGASFSP